MKITKMFFCIVLVMNTAKANTVATNGETCEGHLYCVIDLAAGSEATSYPVSYLSDVPSEGWTDEYKTTKLVLRRIEPGMFFTEGNILTSISRPFYIGVFEVTQRQYELLMGNNPAHYKGAMRPVNVSYNTIRGASLGAGWPSSTKVDENSFLGKLRARTGIETFDLPTGAQWEYSCRALTTTDYNNGGNKENDLKTLGRYNGNTGDGRGGEFKQHTNVGSYSPNGWGLFDMHGNVWEWCLDWWSSSYCGGNDPKGAETGSSRVIRGGSWYVAAYRCTSLRHSEYKSPSVSDGAGYDHGFRLCCAASTVNVTNAVDISDLMGGLIAHFTFDGDANDSSGNGNNGILHGVTSTADRYGKVNGAYHFDGISAYIEIPDSTSLRELGQALTLSAWIRPKTWTKSGASTYWASVLCKGNESMEYGLQINKSSYWAFNHYDETQRNDVNVARNLWLDEWNHVAITYSPTIIVAYLNGEIIGAKTTNGELLENSHSLYVGIDLPGAIEYFSGDMDEIRIYNRALSTAEVRALSNGDDPVAVMTDESTCIYRYTVGDGIGIVQSGIGEVNSSLDIPNMMDGKAIVSIGRYAFANCGSIDTVTIPSSVTEIGEYAFAGCANLSQVMLPSDTKMLKVGCYAFDSMTEVSICDRQGYVFVGWTNTAGRVISDPFHSESSVVVSPVWLKTAKASIDGRIWAYTISDEGHITIGNGKDLTVDPTPIGNLIVPEEINGYPVTGIGVHAFAGYKDMRSITIPRNVTSIGYGAFEECTGLTNVIIETGSFECFMPGLIQTKFDTRFDVTSTLDDSTNVLSFVSGVIAAYTVVENRPWEFSDPVTGKVYAWNDDHSTYAYFGQMYFEAGKRYVFGAHFDDDTYVNIDGCQILKFVYPDTVNKIGTASYECISSGWHNVEFRLGDIDGRKGSWGNVWGDDFGVGYRYDGNTSTAQNEWSHLLDSGDGSLFRCTGDSTVFKGCSNIVSVTIPWSHVSRMSMLFPDAYNGLETITLTGETVDVPTRAFAGYTSLRSLDIPNTVTNIGASAFFGCNGLKNITIPDAVENIGDSAFYFCGGLTNISVGVANAVYKSVNGLLLTKDGKILVRGINGNVVVPNTVTDIKAFAFSGCNELRNVTIPDGVVDIGDSAFAFCGGLNSILVGVANDVYKSANGLLLTKDGKMLIRGINGNVTIPDTVTDINNYAFSGCTGLQSVTIPQSVINLGNDVFHGCRGLMSVKIQGDIPNAGYGIYSCCPESLVTYVPLSWTGPTDMWQDRAVAVMFGSSTLHGESVNVSTNWACQTLGIPVSWFLSRPSFVTAVLEIPAANGTRSIAECYALGIDPEDPYDDFRIIRFWMKDDKPMFEFSHTVDGDGRSFEARIRKSGKVSLDDNTWEPVPKEGNPTFRFFKVTVEMP